MCDSSSSRRPPSSGPASISRTIFALVQKHAVGVKPLLVYNTDETGYSDWEERGPSHGIVPAAWKNQQLHLSVTGRIKYQTMLVCMNAAGETLSPLNGTTNRSTLGIFRDGTTENVALKVHVGRSAYADAILFHDYLRDILIPRIENFREANETPDSPAIHFMDNCSSHLTEHIIGLLSAHKIKILTFPPHSSGIFQKLDLVFFGSSSLSKGV
jgi:hypothetical protein